MKLLAFIAGALLIALASKAQTASISIEDISPHLSNDAQIIWKAPTNHLPKTFWTYQKQSQRFSAAAVSNAIVLGKFELKPFPKTFDKRMTVWDKSVEGDPQPDYFSIEPEMGLLAFRRQRHHVGEGDYPPDALIKRTWQYAGQLGLDRSLLAQAIVMDGTISLPRKVDGIAFRDDMEGFSVQYGPRGEILNLSLLWPLLERVAQERAVGADEIIRCMRAFKTPVLPGNDEADYLGRVKSLASIRTLTITNITPYYTEGRYAEQPSETEPEKFVEPIAVLDAIADWGVTNAPVKLLAPFIASDVNRLMKPAHSKTKSR